MTMRNNRFPSSSKRTRTMSRLTTINESFNSPSPLTNKKRKTNTPPPPPKKQTLWEKTKKTLFKKKK